MQSGSLSAVGLRDLQGQSLWASGAPNSLTQSETVPPQKHSAGGRASPMQGTDSKSVYDPCCAGPSALPLLCKSEAESLKGVWGTCCRVQPAQAVHHGGWRSPGPSGRGRGGADRHQHQLPAGGVWDDGRLQLRHRVSSRFGSLRMVQVGAWGPHAVLWVLDHVRCSGTAACKRPFQTQDTAWNRAVYHGCWIIPTLTLSSGRHWRLLCCW